MNTYLRLPWYKRLFSLQIWQSIDAIEITATGLRLKKGPAWIDAPWSQIQHASLQTQQYLQGNRQPKRLTSDLLSFAIEGIKYSIDLSLQTPHFEKNEELRTLLLEKMHPATDNQSFQNRMKELCMIIGVTLVVVCSVIFLSGR